MNDASKANQNPLRAATKLAAVALLCFWLAVLLNWDDLPTLLGRIELFPSKEDIAKKIPWEPVVLPHQHCPKLSGKYENMEMVANTENAKKKYEIWGDASRSRLMDSIHSEDGLRGDSIRMLHESPRPSGLSFEELGKFEKITPVDVWFHEGTSTLSFYQTDDDLNQQRGELVDLNSIMIGCDGTDLIIRDITISKNYYYRGRYWTFATEMRFRKLDDGNLQMTYDTRKWWRHPVFGLQKMFGETKESMVFLNLSDSR